MLPSSACNNAKFA